MAGVIYVVATPIGNLEDITLRALRVLKQADLVACEDTRRTRILLDHYQIRKPVISYHEHNEAARAEELVRRAAEGACIVVVSDAGLPAIADAGYRVVTLAIARGVPVVPLPGPVAAETALAVSGLPCEAFRFGGFLPPKRGRRRRLLEALAAETATLIFYESPRRILDTLHDVAQVLGARPVVVAREMTKVHEEFLRGPAAVVRAELSRRPAIQGEITLLIGRAAASPAPAPALAGRVEELIRVQRLDKMSALKQAAREHGLSKREAYRQLQQEIHNRNGGQDG